MNKTNQRDNVNEDATRFLSFSLGREQYAIPLLCVKEVVAMPETTRVPGMPTYFLGIMNLRGQIISVFDLRSKFGIKSENTSESVVIICDYGSLVFGIVASSVNSVLAISKTEINEKPNIENTATNAYITGVVQRGDKLTLLLDLAKALNVEDRMAIKKAE